MLMPVKRFFKRLLLPLVQMETYVEIPMRHHRISVDRDLAISRINSVRPRRECAIVAHNTINMRYDLMVIVPVYNVSSYLEQCIDSILSQGTHYSFHIVIVDDGSNDGSSDILKRYQNNESITLISKTNGGLSSARNAALRHIIGRYIMFVDSDDIVAPHAFETMLDMAFKWDADAVEGSVEFFKERSIVEVQKRKQSVDKDDTTSYLRGQAWAKLYRGELFRNIQYPEGYLYEDSIHEYCIHPKITRAYTISDVVYKYRLNPSGITQTSKVQPKSLDTIWITDSLFRYYVDHYPNVSNAKRLEELIDQIALNYKRTERLDDPVRQSVFAISCDWMRRYFNDDDIILVQGKRQMLAKALVKRDYGQYRLFCSRWRFLK